MDVTRETTVGQLLDRAKFKPGDVVTHKACPPGVYTKMVVLCGYVPFTAEQAAGERGYFVRVSEHGSRSDALRFNLEKFSESELQLLSEWVDPLGLGKAAQRFRENATELRDKLNGQPQAAGEPSTNPATA